MEQIVRTGSVTRGWIGVEVQDISAELAESFKLSTPRGTLIAGVLRGGPADRAGIKPGDILVSVESSQVLDSTSMLNLVAALEPGKPATLKILRNRDEMLVKVNVGKRPRPNRRNELE
jgi:serine protease DegQ